MTDRQPLAGKLFKGVVCKGSYALGSACGHCDKCEAEQQYWCTMSKKSLRPAVDPYLIWSHEHGKWWAPGRAGYTSKISEAGRCTRASALAICVDAIPGTANRLGAMPELPVRLADLMEVLGSRQGALGAPGTSLWE